MSRNLDNWREDVSAYDDMLDTRQEAYNQRVPKADAVMAATDLDGLTQKRVDFESRINEIEKSNDVAALGTPEEQQTWATIEGASRTISRRIRMIRILREMRDKHRLMKGVMYWRLSESFKARLWNERRSVKELEGGDSRKRRSGRCWFARREQACRPIPAATRDASRPCARAWIAAATPGGCVGKAESISAGSRHPRTRTSESAHRDLPNPGALRTGGDLRPARRTPTKPQGEAMKRAFAAGNGTLAAAGCALAVAAALAASPAPCGEKPPPTIKDLETQQVDVSTDPPQERGFATRPWTATGASSI